MIHWILILVGGLLGSAHCLGMCGGFVLILGTQQPNPLQNLMRQLLYSCGRISVYTLAGAFAGLLGRRLTLTMPTVTCIQAVLCIAAGLFLIVQGLTSAGVIPSLRIFSSAPKCAASTFSALLRGRAWSQVFVAGAANGLLPCGLVYAYLTLACSASHIGYGAATMALFGLGTIPSLVLLGMGGSLLNATWRSRFFRIAAWCVVLTGIISVVRGAGFLPMISPAEGQCSLCH